MLGREGHRGRFRQSGYRPTGRSHPGAAAWPRARAGKRGQAASVGFHINHVVMFSPGAARPASGGRLRRVRPAVGAGRRHAQHRDHGRASAAGADRCAAAYHAVDARRHRALAGRRPGQPAGLRGRRPTRQQRRARHRHRAVRPRRADAPGAGPGRRRRAVAPGCHRPGRHRAPDAGPGRAHRDRARQCLGLVWQRRGRRRDPGRHAPGVVRTRPRCGPRPAHVVSPSCPPSSRAAGARPSCRSGCRASATAATRRSIRRSCRRPIRTAMAIATSARP